MTYDEPTDLDTLTREDIEAGTKAMRDTADLCQELNLGNPDNIVGQRVAALKRVITVLSEHLIDRND